MVVIGSVTDKQYQRLLKPYVSSGQSVEIIRIPDDSLQEFLEIISEGEDGELLDSVDESYELAIQLFCAENGFVREDVVEVIARACEWESILGDPIREHAFGHFHYAVWPNLEHVTLCHGKWYETV